MDDREILDRLGTSAVTAYELSHPDYGIVSADSVRQWKRTNRIPIKYRLAISRLAERRGLTVPEDFTTRFRP